MYVMTIGQRIAIARKRRAWTQEQLAAALGYSKSWVEKAERNKIRLDRMSVLDRVAEVLSVELVELTGQPYRHDAPARDSGHAGIPALRLALQRATLPSYASAVRAPRPLAELRAEVETAETLRQAAKFAVLGEVMPALVEDLTAAHRAAAGGARDELAALVVRAAHISRVTADLTGHHDLAWTAVDLELRTAAELGAPAPSAAATWDLVGVWLHAGADALHSARTAALSGIDALAEHVGRDAELTHMWGAMHLRAAVTAARLWDAAAVREHLAEAARVAPATGNPWQTMFNAPNVAIHALETAVELGQPRDALGLADRVPVEVIASTERRTHYWTCRARALGMSGHDGPAFDALLEAERLAPQHVYNRPMTRELVLDLLHRGRRPDPALRAFAVRAGLTA